ncbi:MAG: urease accessory protein UreD [Cyanobacteria bacterium J06632_22]
MVNTLEISAQESSTPVSTFAQTDASVWRGSADLRFGLFNGKTRLFQVRTQAPLRVLRSHYPEGLNPCYTTLVHTAGGMVGGDQLSQNITLEPATRALITTPAAAKVYQSIGPTSTVQTHISVDAGAALEWFPQETIIFAGARYHQALRVNLAERATVLLWDITRFGRSARGETFSYGNWTSDVEIWQNGQPLWIDRQALAGNSLMRLSPTGLNGCPVIGTLALAGYLPTETEINVLRDSVTRQQIPLENVGITTGLSGLICRYRGHSSQTARQFFTTVWQQLRAMRYGKIPPVPRVWN